MSKEVNNSQHTEQTAQFEPESRLELAGQWTLMWWKFRKHKVALVCTILIFVIYLIPDANRIGIIFASLHAIQ